MLQDSSVQQENDGLWKASEKVSSLLPLLHRAGIQCMILVLLSGQSERMASQQLVVTVLM